MMDTVFDVEFKNGIDRWVREPAHSVHIPYTIWRNIASGMGTE